MALTAISGTGTAAVNVTATLTPPVGKTWIIQVDLGIYNYSDNGTWATTEIQLCLGGQVVRSITWVASAVSNLVLPHLTFKAVLTNSLPLTMKSLVTGTNSDGGSYAAPIGYHYTGFEL